jgi:hypothetical protein
LSADIAAHYAAVRALLPSGLQSYSGVVPDTPVYPYVVIWGSPGTEDSEALSDDPSTLTLRAYATYAGLSFDSVAITISRVRAVLNRARPVVAGRVTSRLVQSSQQPIQADLGVSVPGIGHPFYAVDQYELISDPA